MNIALELNEKKTLIYISYCKCNNKYYKKYINIYIIQRNEYLEQKNVYTIISI
jgi:hypothetical protein